MQIKGYEKPQFDNRVKRLLEIDNSFNLLRRVIVVLIVTLVTMAVFGSVVKAQSVEDSFMVPLVKLTGSGAAVIQPQTGAGYDALNKNTYGTLQNPLSTANDSSYLATDSAYKPPKYDPFIEGTADQKVPLPVEPVKEFGNVSIRISNNLQGSSDPAMGTTSTLFNFSAYIVDGQKSYGNMEYRWDFDGDYQFDSYFSKISNHSHIYKLPGEYLVTVQVLDNNGEIHSASEKVVVVENEPPKAAFTANKTFGPVNSIVRFNTELSSDSQQNRSTLKYRFDFDGDGRYDTNFQNKTNWAHQYRESGSFDVAMEVIDPDGLTDKATLTVDISEDNPPEARLSVERNGDFNYRFDGSMSSDEVTPLNKLKFRWDFNYTGVNDIVFDTSWSGSPKQSGSYRIGGSKTVRLQVKDEQGLIAETFAQIEVPWTESLVNLAVGML